MQAMTWARLQDWMEVPLQRRAPLRILPVEADRRWAVDHRLQRSVLAAGRQAPRLVLWIASMPLALPMSHFLVEQLAMLPRSLVQF